jgi:hypothetical protein
MSHDPLAILDEQEDYQDKMDERDPSDPAATEYVPPEEDWSWEDELEEMQRGDGK